MDLQKIGACLRELRKRNGLTQEQLAERLHVSGRTVSRWENGVHMPDLELLVELTDFYEIDLRALLRGELLVEKMTRETIETVHEAAKYSRAKERLKKIGRGMIFSVLILLVVLLICAILFHFSFPFIASAFVQGEYNEAIASLNNPYIDDALDDWKEIRLSKNTVFKIPNEWEFSQKGDRFYIVSEGEVIAHGIRVPLAEAIRAFEPSETEQLHPNDMQYYEYWQCEAVKDFNTEMFSLSGDFEWESMYKIHTSILADYGLLTVTDENGRSETHYHIDFDEDPEYFYAFDFGKKEGDEYPMLKYVEAIAYSYHTTDE